MRLFVAVTPPQEVQDHLETALESVRLSADDGAAGAGADLRSGPRWSPPQNRHVTLAFYGEVPDGYLDELGAALDELAAAHQAFDAALRGAGTFDGRTLWVGCGGDGWSELMAAAGDLGVEMFGRRPDHRSRPHLTIARAGNRGTRAGNRGTRASDRGPGPGDRTRGRGRGDGGLATIAHALALYAGPTWTVPEIALVSSHLGQGPGGGPRYDVEHVSRLGEDRVAP